MSNGLSAGRWLHAPNRKLADLPGGAGAFWQRAELMGATGVKLLHNRTYITHTRADALEAKRRGMDVMVRVEGESEIDTKAFRAAIVEFGAQRQGGIVVEDAAALWLMMGNEPMPGLIWQHLATLQTCLDESLDQAHDARLLVAGPGFASGAEPFPLPPDDRDWQEWPEGTQQRLWARFHQQYRRLDAVGVHTYGKHVFDGHQARVRRWREALRLLIIVDEAGIASKLVSPQQKAERFVQLADDLADVAEAVCWFIDRGSTPEWGSFEENGKFDPHGSNSYWLTDSALGWIGQQGRRVPGGKIAA